MGINFQALVRYEEFTALEERGGRTYRLRDDMPAELMLDCYALIQIDRDLAAVRLPDEAGEEQRAAIAQVEDILERKAQLIEEICLAIFQHSLPGVTAEELDQSFTLDQQRAIIDDFFIRRWRQSREQMTATPPADAPTNPAPTTGSPSPTPARAPAPTATALRRQRQRR